MRNRHLLSVLLLAFSLPASAAQKGAPAAEYLAKHNLPSKTVQIKQPGFAATRTFVPILPTSREDFLTTFGEKNGRTILRWGTDLEHPGVYFAPKSGLSYGGY